MKKIYTDKEFNEKDIEFTDLVTKLKQDVELAENEATTTIDGIVYPASLIWREVAETALKLADLSEWFDRYSEQDNDSDKYELVRRPYSRTYERRRKD